MSGDQLLSNVSHFNSTSISGVVRAGREEGGANVEGVFCLWKCVLFQKPQMPPAEVRKIYTPLLSGCHSFHRPAPSIIS